MVITIDQSIEEPIYLQIRSQIVAAIARGDLQPADSLPSVRRLAESLGINLHTVNKAYAVLRDEGYLLMRGRRGAVVADYQGMATPERTNAADQRLFSSLQQLAIEYKARGGTAEGFCDLARKAFE